MAPLSDDELVAAAQGGDRNALETITRASICRLGTSKIFILPPPRGTRLLAPEPALLT